MVSSGQALSPTLDLGRGAARHSESRHWAMDIGQHNTHQSNHSLARECVAPSQGSLRATKLATKLATKSLMCGQRATQHASAGPSHISHQGQNLVPVAGQLCQAPPRQAHTSCLVLPAVAHTTGTTVMLIAGSILGEVHIITHAPPLASFLNCKLVYMGAV